MMKQQTQAPRFPAHGKMGATSFSKETEHEASAYGSRNRCCRHRHLRKGDEDGQRTCLAEFRWLWVCATVPALDGTFSKEFAMQTKEVIEVVKTLVEAARPIIEAIQEAAEKLGK